MLILRLGNFKGWPAELNMDNSRVRGLPPQGLEKGGCGVEVFSLNIEYDKMKYKTLKIYCYK